MPDVQRAQLASTVAIAGGGFLLVFSLLVAFGANPDGVAASLIFAAGALLLMALPLGLRLLRVAGDGRLGRFGPGVTLLGLAFWIVGMAAIIADPASADTQPFTPIAAGITTIGMLMLGIGTIRAGRLTGWRRFGPLFPALYYIAMMPVQAVAFIGPNGTPSYELIGLWGAAWIAAAWSVHQPQDLTVASPATRA